MAIRFCSPFTSQVSIGPYVRTWPEKVTFRFEVETKYKCPLFLFFFVTITNWISDHPSSVCRFQVIDRHFKQNKFQTLLYKHLNSYNVYLFPYCHFHLVVTTLWTHAQCTHCTVSLTKLTQRGTQLNRTTSISSHIAVADFVTKR